MNSRSGVAALVVLAGLAVVTGVTWLVKPSLFPGAAKRAAASTQATTTLLDAAKARSAAAAASVVKIGEANALAPDSPAKEFIRQEVPVALARQEAPAPLELLAAERRRTAVMEGRLDEARRLYTQSSQTTVKLEKALASAIAARREADTALEQAAAAEHARTLQLLGAGAIALLFAAAWIYLKVYNVSPETLGVMAAEMRQGHKNPVQVLTDNLAPRHYKRVEKAAKLATPLS